MHTVEFIFSAMPSNISIDSIEQSLNLCMCLQLSINGLILQLSINGSILQLFTVDQFDLSNYLSNALSIYQSILDRLTSILLLLFPSFSVSLFFLVSFFFVFFFTTASCYFIYCSLLSSLARLSFFVSFFLSFFLSFSDLPPSLSLSLCLSLYIYLPTYPTYL